MRKVRETYEYTTTMNKGSVYTLNGGAKGDEEGRLVHQHRDFFIRVTKTLKPERYAHWLRTEVQYATSVGRGIM